MKGLSDGGVDGLNRTSRDGGRPSSRAWSPGPGQEGFKKDRDLEPPSLGPRSTSPTPSGRLKADSQLAGSSSMPPPIFSSHYNREHSLLYQRFPFNRAESTSLKPTSTSTLGFPAGGRKADLPSPGGRDSAHYSKFSPLRGERDREDFEASSGPANIRNKEFDGAKSPPGDMETDSQRPSSSDQFDLRAKQMTSDSSTEKGVSPGGQSSRRYPDIEPDRSGGRHSQDLVKTERASSPPGPEPRTRTFSGDFSRESLSRLSQSSGGSRGESFINQTAQGEFQFDLTLCMFRICISNGLSVGCKAILLVWNCKSSLFLTRFHFTDLRTNDHDRDKNLERFEQLRRMAETRGFAGNNMSTIQAIRDSFLPPGGFTLPVTAPLGIPASDLARIAVTVPDPAANGEPTSGTGNIREREREIFNIFSILLSAGWSLNFISFVNFRDQIEMSFLWANLRLRNQPEGSHPSATPGHQSSLSLLPPVLHQEQHSQETHTEGTQASDQTKLNTNKVWQQTNLAGSTISRTPEPVRGPSQLDKSGQD